MARTRRRVAWRKSKRWNPRGGRKTRRKGRRYFAAEERHRYDGVGVSWAVAKRFARRGPTSSTGKSMKRYKGSRVVRANPPISAGDLKVLRRILAVHERYNRAHRGRGKRRSR